MNTLAPAAGRTHRILPPPCPRPPRRRWGVLVLLALAAGLVFCHGCHSGDHDDEPGFVWFKGRMSK